MGGISVTGTASSDDGSVTVEVGLGGGLHAVRMTPQALTRGTDQLARAVLAASKRATTKANYTAHRQLGADAEGLTALGLDYDPELLAENDYQENPLGWQR